MVNYDFNLNFSYMIIIFVIFEGIFIMNLICRKDALKNEILEKLKSIWKYIYINKLKKSRNEIIFCTNNENLLQKYDFKKDELFNKSEKHVNNKDLFVEMSKNLFKLK